MISVPGLKIEGPLGRGGTAEVSKAYSVEFSTDVAVKYPLSENPESKSQFQILAEREFKLIGELKSPGVVKLLKYSNNPAYLLLELCNGQSLDKLGKVEEPEMLLHIISSIAANLEFLRLNKLVHCDLKPHNIFLPLDFPLYENGKLFFTKISDFSLGRFDHEPETARAGHGTVGYAAPETLKNGKSSHRADLFALGVIAYQLATGKHPFGEDESDPVKIESRIQEDQPESITKYRSDLSKEVLELLISLLSKDENARPSSGWLVCQKLRLCGCLYPFEKVVTPSFLLKSHNDYEKCVNEFLDLTAAETEQLENLTDSNPEYLRLILTSNFNKQILHYTGEKFVFRTSIYWPSILRRKSLSHFSNASRSAKKEIIRLSVTASRKTRSQMPPGTTLLFAHLLSNKLVKLCSFKAANGMKSNNEFSAAAKLFLQAGLLTDAINCAEKATKDLKDADSRANAIHLINRVSEFAHFVGKEFETRQLLMIKGDIERANGDIDNAQSTYNRIIELYRDNAPDKLLAETYRDLGDLYKTKQKFQLGIEVLNKAIEIYRGLKDDLDMSRTLNNIGELYRIATDLPNSLKFTRQALAIQKRLRAAEDTAKSLNNIAILCGTSGKLKRAIRIFNLSLKVNRNLGEEVEIAKVLNNLGYAYFLTGNQADAAKVLRESLDINRKLGNKKEILFNLWNLSEVSFKFGNLRQCLKYLEEGLQLATALADKPHSSRYHLSLGNALRYLGRLSEAASHFDKVSLLSDEIDDEVLKINLQIDKAVLRFQIGDFGAAKMLAESALHYSQELKIQSEMLEALNILIILTGNDKYLKLARERSSEKLYDKNRLKVEFSYIQYLINSEFIQDAQRIIGPYEAQLLKQPSDIDMPHLLNVLGEYHIKLKEFNEAKVILDKSYDSAKSQGLLIDEMNAAILLGNVAFGAGGYEQSFAKYKMALNLCKQVVNGIEANADKKIFMNKPKVKLLVTEINKLGEKLAAKEKAGV